MASKSANQWSNGESIGCSLAIIVLLLIGYAVYYFVFTPDNELLSGKYDVPKERVYVQAKPHGCAFTDSPLGEKHCHYEKHVVVYAKNRLVIEKDGSHVTECPSCAAWTVEQTWQKVEE